jgi:hypothetical protein
MSAPCAVLAALIYSALAGLHAYWALGGLWPGKDRDSFNRSVVGGRPGMRGPGPIASWMVAAVLGVAAVTVLGGSGLVHTPIARAWLRAGALAGAAVLGLRGLEGFVDTRVRPQTVGSPFARLNVRLYSPLCLLLALCTVTAVIE